MHACCERNGWQILGEFVDNKDYVATKRPKRGRTVNPSGERDDRLKLLEMLKLVETGKPDIILYWREDR